MLKANHYAVEMRRRGWPGGMAGFAAAPAGDQNFVGVSGLAPPQLYALERQAKKVRAALDSPVTASILEQSIRSTCSLNEIADALVFGGGPLNAWTNRHFFSMDGVELTSSPQSAGGKR
jgi:hypothetical protein